MRTRLVRFLLGTGCLVIALASVCSTDQAFAAASKPVRPIVVVVLPLTPVDTDLPDAPLPSPSELASLTTALRAAIGSARQISLSNQEQIGSELHTLGYQQDSTSRSCIDAGCARQIGQVLQATVVVYGSVTRLMAVIWSTEVWVVDVRSGRLLGDIQGGYKGDFTAMQMGERRIGSKVAGLVILGRAQRRR